MTFDFKLNGTGWADGQLEMDGERLEFEVSYLCDPITDVLEGIISITPDYAATNLGNNLMDSETSFLWKGEPWGYLWMIKFHSFENLQIKIVSIDDIFDKVEIGKTCFEATCNYFEFLTVVVDELTLLLKKHGLVGYYETWAGKTNFPVAEFLKLKHILRTKNPIEIGIVEPTNPEHKGNATRSTNLDMELQLLIYGN